MATNDMKVSVKSNLDLTGAQIEVLRDSTCYGVVTFCINTNQWMINLNHCNSNKLAERYLKEIALSGKPIDEHILDGYIDILNIGNGEFVAVSDEHFLYTIHGKGGDSSCGFVFLDPIKIKENK